MKKAMAVKVAWGVQAVGIAIVLVAGVLAVGLVGSMDAEDALGVVVHPLSYYLGRAVGSLLLGAVGYGLACGGRAWRRVLGH